MICFRDPVMIVSVNCSKGTEVPLGEEIHTITFQRSHNPPELVNIKKNYSYLSTHNDSLYF